MAIRYHIQPTIKPDMVNTVPDYDREEREQLRALKQDGACSQDEASSRVHAEAMEFKAFRPKQRELPAELEAAAKAICSSCVVLELCRDYALPRYNILGNAVIANMNPKELETEAKRLGIKPVAVFKVRGESLED